MPSCFDRYLARFGYQSQMSAEPASKDAPDNLFKPIEGDFGAHGRFDAQALPSVDVRSPVLPNWFVTGGAMIGLFYLMRTLLKGQSRAAPRLQ